MESGKVPAHAPRWFWIPVRVLLVTFLLTLLSFAVSLLLGILGTAVVAWMRGVPPNMTHAYRHIAAPVAIAAAAMVLVAATPIEIRRYRRPRRWQESNAPQSHAEHRMNKRTRVLVAGIALLMAWGPAGYTIRILDPYLRADASVSNAPGFGSDLYPRWIGVQTILHHGSPYDRATTDAIQVGYYGHVLRNGETRDPQPFAYPAHVAVVLAPLALLDFHQATILFVLLLTLTTILATLMWLRMAQRPNQDGWSLGIAALLTLASWPVIQGIYAQQLTLLVAAFLAFAFYCASRNQLAAAGLSLAFSTIKPQLSWLAVGWLLIWGLSDVKRRKLAWWFAGATLILLLVSEFLVFGWLRVWLFTLHDYLRYTGSRLNLQVLVGNAVGDCLTAGVVGWCGFVLWRLRNSDSTSEQFKFATALLLALTLVVLPTWSWASYNQVLLIPAALYLWAHWGKAMAGQLGVRLFYGLTVVALGWSYLATVYLASAHLMGAAISRESQIRLPTYNYFLVAPLTLLSVYLLRPKTTPAPE